MPILNTLYHKTIIHPVGEARRSDYVCAPTSCIPSSRCSLRCGGLATSTTSGVRDKYKYAAASGSIDIALADQSLTLRSVDATKSADCVNVPVTFTVCHRRVEFGQCLKVVGSGPVLGDWNPGVAPCMEWSQGDGWSTKALRLTPGRYEFKFVVVSDTNDVLMWEQGPNKVLTIEAQLLSSAGSSTIVQVESEWEGVSNVVTSTVTAQDPKDLKDLKDPHHSSVSSPNPSPQPQPGPSISVSEAGYETDDDSRFDYVEVEENKPYFATVKPGLLAILVPVIGLLLGLFFRGPHKF